ncbi:Trans-2,3-dihydro-3-hydroxyanthranilate isomerase [Cyphellophora attinorum]|uniref:Trans-2,3-dihydro-3-hydroxyanthranilate isomerase n=1 Tax=Cyphellophora attinorum TaxID=1664694 RepID=A0A0N1P0E7_9EURO|nr:Trans-2,3-dihydro-3-hydroxyanthranilate isomerase [Phialophora attinorum]KPI42115.1 Trans-2,3-dihydro-3-hydroxyanthranilate isomerase [Phialophora attinorum]
MAPTKLQFVTTDVFTTKAYEGNPLGLVRLPKSQKLTQDQKQKIAFEFNLSETVILHESEESYRTSEWTFDIFITTSEIPFAGHPTIGTICYLGRSLQATGSGGVIEGKLKCKAGLIPWKYDTSSGAASAEIPHDSHLHSTSLDIRGLHAIGVQEDVTKSFLNSAPIVSIVKGMTFCLSLPREGLTPEYASTGVAGLFFYHVTGEGAADGTTGIRTRMIRTRMILDHLEDPATGSASATLSVYLSKHHPKLRNTQQKLHKFELTQGVEIGRKSVIGVDVSLDGAGKVEKVVLNGTAVEIMEGNITVP